MMQKNRAKTDFVKRSSRAPVLQQLIEKEIKTLRDEVAESLGKMDERMRMITVTGGNTGGFSAAAPDDPFFSDRAAFIRKKEAGTLFDNIDHQARMDASKNISSPLGIGNSKYKFNDEVVYELYNRYKQIIEELDNYKQNLFYFVEGDTPEQELNEWNSNLSGRVETIEQQSKNTIMKSLKDLLSLTATQDSQIKRVEKEFKGQNEVLSQFNDRIKHVQN